MENDKRKTAVVTGATSGIGAAYAKRLAERGYNLILHGRRREKLESMASELKVRYSIASEVITAELSDAGESMGVEERIRELDRVDMLVNNAGYWTPGNFAERDPESIEAMIRAHVIAPVRFIRAALPGMLDRNRGDIINVSSIAAYYNNATMENYCATKAYLISFTESLHKALTGTGLRVQVVVPGYTRTEFHSRIGLDPEEISTKWMPPEEVVEVSLQCLDRGCVVCVPKRRSRVIIGLMRSMWRWYNRLTSNL
jgi:short-subunit dehydrogenase